MNDRHRLFFDLLEMALAQGGNSATSADDLRHTAALAAKELKRIMVEETVMPERRIEAVAAYRSLLPELRRHLDASLCVKLDEALANTIKDRAAHDRPALDEALNEVTTALLAINDNSMDSSSRTLAARVIAIDAQLRADKEAACRRPSTLRPPAASETVSGGLDAEQQARLLDFLQRSFPDERGLGIAGIRPLGGGFSKQTLFIELSGNTELPSTLVMRRDAPYVTHGSSVSMEFAVLHTLHAHDIKVPRPYALDGSGDVLGTPFMLVSRVGGRILGDFLVVAETDRTVARSVALNLARQVARLHGVPIDALQALLPGGAVSVQERVMDEINNHETIWHGVVHQHDYVVQAALDWLRMNIALAEGPRAIVHRDIGVHNLLIDDDHDVSAFLDWETVVIGTPAEDIGYGYHQMIQMIDWEEFVATYEAVAGARLDRRQLDFYTLWGDVRIVIGMCRLVDPVYSGERASLLHFYVGDYFVQSLLQRIAAKLAQVLAVGTARRSLDS